MKMVKKQKLMEFLSKIIQEEIDSLMKNGKLSHLTVFHGTNSKNVDSIKNVGLKNKMGYDNSEWFMVSTDFESALFHATPEEDGGEVYVLEFSVPISDKPWVGYPYFWPEYKRNGNSSWYSLKKELEPKLIKKTHQIPNEVWLDRKSKKY